MGIHGLHQVIRRACTGCNIRDPAFAGTTAGVDISLWLYRSQMSNDPTVLGETTKYIFEMLDLLKKNNIKLIIVFDGRQLPAKAVTHEKRRVMRQKQNAKAEALQKEATLLLTAGKVHESKTKQLEAAKLFKYSRNVHPPAQALIKQLQQKKIDYIISPYEADAQLAWMSRNCMIDFVITEDSDLVVFGCQQILFKLDRKGNGVFYQRNELESVFRQGDEDFTFDEFRSRCILSGCDYLPSIQGIGIVKADNLANQTKGMDPLEMTKTIESILKQKKHKYKVPDDYAIGYDRAIKTFQHQVVFDFQNKRFDNIQKPHFLFENEDLSYAGDLMTNINATDFALGNINAQSMQNIASFQTVLSGYPTDSIWDPSYKIPSRAKLIIPYSFRPKTSMPETMTDDTNFDCKDCGHMFKTLEDIKDHWLMYGGGKSWICDVCALRYESDLELKTHCLFQHNPDPDLSSCIDKECAAEVCVIALVPGPNVTKKIESFICTYNGCNEEFKMKYDLGSHMLVHSTEGPLLCFEEHCNELCESINELANHILTHTDQKPFVCEGCTEIFGNMDELLIHKNSHNPRGHCKKKHACRICSETGHEIKFKTKGELRRHNQRVHTTDKPYACPVTGCESKFKIKGDLDRHNHVHNTDKPHACQVEGCDSRFKRKSELKTHQRVHTTDKPHVCPVTGCESRYKTKGDLDRHIRAHNTDKPHACQVEGCDSRFKTKWDLHQHQLVHTTDKPHVCTVNGCDQKFKTKWDLQQHELVHTTDKPHACQVEGCDQKFKTKGGLHLHQQVHTTDKPYICPVGTCNSGFKRKGDLDRHIRAHNTDKPHACQVEGCDQKFKTKRGVHLHQQVHTTDKPYICPVSTCNSGFKRKSDLKRHHEKYHTTNILQNRNNLKRHHEQSEITEHISCPKKL